MSELRGDYRSVICATCGDWKAGELLSNASSSALVPRPPEADLLGRRVKVVLARKGEGEGEGEDVVARGVLLRYSAMGEVVLQADDGDVHWCWPALEMKEDAEHD